MSGHDLKKMSGKSQAEREANCQQRLAAHRKMPPAKRLTHFLDSLNYSFQGGFSGIYHGAKKRAADEAYAPDVRAVFREAADWGTMAFALAKRPDRQDLALMAAVNATSAMSRASGMVAVGWVDPRTMEPK